MTEPDINDGADEVKAEIYEAMGVINRSFAQITSALYKLEAEGVLVEDYAYNEQIVIRELAAKINCQVLANVNGREEEDRKDYGRMRERLKKR